MVRNLQHSDSWLQAYGIESVFTFVSEANLPVEITVVLRVTREYLCGRSDAMFAKFGDVHALSVRGVIKG